MKFKGNMAITKDIYIGVDGGATKCKVHIENAHGQALAQAISGPANINVSVNDAWDSIHNAVQAALAKVDLDLKNQHHDFHVGLGLAGIEVSDKCDRFIKRLHPFTNFRLESDAYAACLGAHNNQDGAIIIIGTGVNGLQTQNGKTV